MLTVKLRHILLFGSLLFAVGAGAEPLSSADTTREYQLRVPSEEFMRRFREDPAFNYSVQREENRSWWNELMWWLRTHLFRTSSKKVGAWLEVGLKIALALLLLFLIYKLTRYYYLQESKKKAGLPGLADDLSADRLVNDDSLLGLLQQAIAASDYERAVRIQYWYTLHDMDKKGWVKWNEHKTNGRYINELEAGKRREDFRRLTYVFDCVCYGEFGVSADLYRRLEREFNDFRQEL